LTEGARSNVFVKLDGKWFTPPVACGLLPGVMRATLLADPAWDARERVLTLDDLLRADEIVVCNALRGPLAARLAARSCYPDYSAWLAYWVEQTVKQTNDRVRSTTETAAVRASAQDHPC
jgi:branched-subunit amino acid aminotransferase/4-amino-4-deoxychorismate lyase